MKLLFISNLFPNGVEPTRGMHNAQQVAALSKQCEIKVISPMHQPVPDETWRGIAVTHPRFVHVPLLSRPLNGWLFARAVEPVIRRERFDIALVNWAYPDAYGVMLMAAKLKFPFATTVQGSDVNVFFRSATRKRQVLRALRASHAVFARSKALQARLADEGIDAVTVYNGIDRERFRPCDRMEACAALGLPPDRRRILFVGNLLPVKGPTSLAAAFKQLDDLRDVDLVFVGSGSEAARLPAGERLFVVGARPYEEIPLWMNACDVLCLPSLSEGLPNVALEAMACGLPVIASRVGGIPEVVRDGTNGFLVPPSDPRALADALRRSFTTKWDRESIRASVSQFDWEANARTLLDALRKALAL
jgi:glycosyltransferase involved in cell wall biosynthesis